MFFRPCYKLVLTACLASLYVYPIVNNANNFTLKTAEMCRIGASK